MSRKGNRSPPQQGSLPEREGLRADPANAYEPLHGLNENLRAQAEHLQTLNDTLCARQKELEMANENLRVQEEQLRSQAEALRESEQRYRTLFETAPDAIVVCKDGRFLDANEAALRLVRAHTYGELATHTVLDFFRPEDREQVVERMRLALTGRRLPMRKARLVRLNGQEVLVEFHTAPVDVQGEKAIQTIIHDITERKRAEEALRELNATLESKVAQRTAELAHRAKQLQKLTLELTQAEERERRRIAVILHEDLQQQIAGAKFHLSLVKGHAKDDRLRAEVNEVDAMLRGAIEKSRSLSHDLSPAVVHMNDLAEVLHWLVNRVRAQQGLSVKLTVSGDMMLHSEALAMFLFRAAQEMLFNVIKHAQVREAAIRVRRIGRYVCLSVSDRGRGFDPQELKETSGMGLFSIRERTELLGGRMRVKSAKGKGSRFSIMVPDGPKTVGVGPRAYPLPIKASFHGDPASAVRRDHDGQEEEGGHGDGSPNAERSRVGSRPPLRVLLVDDHEAVRQGLAAMLREAPGIELVGEASDGREAINLATDLQPDVVIMDVSMPVMGGDEATRQIKEYLPKTRVIALSMYDDADKKESMFQAGAEGYILKTISADDLIAAIRGQERPPDGPD